nr:hypothetical protein [uncultured bacterium]
METAITNLALALSSGAALGLSLLSSVLGRARGGLRARRHRPGATLPDFERRLRRSFQAAPSGRVSLNTEYGMIKVVPIDGELIEFELVRSVSAKDKPSAEEIFDDFRIDFRESEGELRIEARFHDGWRPFTDKGNLLGMFKGGCHLVYWNNLREHKFQLRLPRNYSVELKTGYGSISVEGLEGEALIDTLTGDIWLGNMGSAVAAETSAGDVRLARSGRNASLKTLGGSIQVGQVYGDLRATTLGGSIGVQTVTGCVEAETLGGRIRIHGVGGAVRAKTGGGSVEVRMTSQPEAESYLVTSSGSVTVYLPESAEVDINADANGSRVSAEFDLDSKVVRGSKLNASINGGGPEIYLRSASGGIYVRKTPTA